MGVIENLFIPEKTRLCALSTLYKNKGNRTVRTMAQQLQLLWFQSVFDCGGKDFCQAFRPMNQEKITAETQRPGSAGEAESVPEGGTLRSGAVRHRQFP